MQLIPEPHQVALISIVMGHSLHSAWCRGPQKTKQEILSWIKGTGSPLSSSWSIGDLKRNLQLGSTEDRGEKSQGHGEIRQGPGLWPIVHIVVYPREQNEDEKQIQVKSTLLQNEHKKWGRKQKCFESILQVGANRPWLSEQRDEALSWKLCWEEGRSCDAKSKSYPMAAKRARICLFADHWLPPFSLHFSYYSHKEYLSLAKELPWYLPVPLIGLNGMLNRISHAAAVLWYSSWERKGSGQIFCQHGGECGSVIFKFAAKMPYPTFWKRQTDGL